MLTSEEKTKIIEKYKIKGKKLWFLIIPLLVIGIGVFIYIEYFTSISFFPSSFSYLPCGGKKVLGFSDYIEEAKWSEDELVIKSVVETNCCTNRLKGEYNIEGDNLILNIKGGFCLFYARCLCSHDTEFKIDNLEKKNYKIILKAHDKEKDYLYLKPDNLIFDYCDDNRTYNCYKNYKYPVSIVEEEKEKKETVISFEKPEYEEIANKYPKFLEFIKKSELLFEECDVLKISFNEKFKTIDIKGYKDGLDRAGSRIQEGDDFEDAVKKYIARKEKEYLAESALINELQERLNLPITIIYVSPNKLFSKFIYKGEEIQYSKSSLKFNDRKVNIDFRFIEENPEIQEITVKELENLIELTDKAYNYIDGNEKLKLLSSIEINKTSQTAEFWAWTNVNESEAEYKIIIHNYELPFTEPIQKHYILNLQTEELQEVIPKSN